MRKLLLIGAIAGILLIGAFLRLYQLTTHPTGFFVDEAGQAYSAYKILHTGRDMTGKFLPFYVTIPYPAGLIGPVAIYDQIPTIAVFGLNEFSARLTPALLGTLTILAVFFLTSELFQNIVISIGATLLSAVSPWHIQFSRFATENIRVPYTLILIQTPSTRGRCQG